MFFLIYEIFLYTLNAEILIYTKITKSYKIWLKKAILISETILDYRIEIFVLRNLVKQKNTEKQFDTIIKCFF